MFLFTFYIFHDPYLYLLSLIFYQQHGMDYGNYRIQYLWHLTYYILGTKFYDILAFVAQILTFYFFTNSKIVFTLESH